MEQNNGWQNEGRKQAKFNNGNRVEFRLSRNGSWIYESMATFFWNKGYISKPTVGEAARFCFHVIATDFIDHGEAITQKLKGITPVRDYNKLELELDSTKAELAAVKKLNLDNEKVIKTQTKAIDTQSNALEYVCNTLKKEQQEFYDFRVITTRSGKRMQEIAKEGGYLKQEAGHISEAPLIILDERQTSLTEEQGKGVCN